MAQQELDFKIRGIAPLLMHNGRLADPLDKFSKELKALSGQRKKTEETYVAMSRVEWFAGLYTNAQGLLILPSTLIEACIGGGAKCSKLGRAFKSAVLVPDDALLVIDTRKPIAELFEDENYRDVRAVKVGQARVMRTRPIFKTWSTTFTVSFDDEQVNEAEVTRAVEDAGLRVGLCDYRPKFGRFEVI